jgi:hypothetical protein
MTHSNQDLEKLDAWLDEVIYPLYFFTGGTHQTKYNELKYRISLALGTAREEGYRLGYQQKELDSTNRDKDGK